MDLWDRYDELCRNVRGIGALIDVMELPTQRSPERAELAALAAQSTVVITALADFLAGVDRARRGEEGDAARAEFDEVHAFLIGNEGAEPERGERVQLERDPHSGRLPWVVDQAARDARTVSSSGVIDRLQDVYFFHVRIENALYVNRIPTTFAWRTSLGVWTAMVYSGGGLLHQLASLVWGARWRATHPPARRDDLVAGRVTAFRREQGFGTITLDDGRPVAFDSAQCTMVPAAGDPVRVRIGPARSGGLKALHVEEPDVEPAAPPPTPTTELRWPWDAHHLGLLHHLAELAAFLATADDAALVQRHRDHWCEQVDATFARRARSDLSDAAVTDLVDQAPPPDAAVDRRLAALADLPHLGDKLRRRLRDKLQRGS